jgi:thiamine-monophosphate kinase
VQSEFEFIHYIKETFGLRSTGDDCAVLPKDSENELLVTADLLIEEIDFRLSWTDAESLGSKALAVSLSDIAAMGGCPRWAMLSLGVSDRLWNSEWLKQFYNGWHELAAKFNVELVGGDISRSPDRLVVDSIVAGEIPHGRAVLRSKAKPGDAIFVSGTLGGAAGGLAILRKEDPHPTRLPDQRLIKKQLRPIPRVELAIFLRENGLATSMIDISDGLSSDIRHICDASRVGAEIEISRLPIDQDLSEIFDLDDRNSFALNGGEDFELLFTVAEENISELETVDVTQIGTITAAIGLVELIDGNSKTVLSAGGYRHF